MTIEVAKRVAKVTIVGVATAVGCGLLALFVTNGTVRRDVPTTIFAAIAYMLPLMALQATVEKAVSRRADAAPFPRDWVIFAGAQLIISLLAATIGSSLVLLLGIVARWQDLYLANRMVVVVSVIASCTIRLLNTTRSRLEERNRQLSEKVQAEALTLRLHEQDLERAREIQAALMPRQLPQITRCQLAAECRPARIVGGDYYDAIGLSDSSVAIAIGDVSGKGMAAALLMSNLQAIVRAFALGGLQPNELCAKANQLIAANVAPGKYITFFYAVVDTENMRLHYCNAGHNPPMLRHIDGSVENLENGGPVLGIFPAASYSAGSVELRSGDCLVLFTDGITEAMNAQDEEFGEDRLLGLFNQRTGGADEYREQILDAAGEFSSGRFHDDATVLVMTMN